MRRVFRQGAEAEQAHTPVRRERPSVNKYKDVSDKMKEILQVAHDRGMPQPAPLSWVQVIVIVAWTSLTTILGLMIMLKAFGE